MTAAPILLGTPHDIEPGDLWRPTAGSWAGGWWDYHAVSREAWCTYFDEYAAGIGGRSHRNPHLVEIVRGAAEDDPACIAADEVAKTDDRWQVG